MKRFNIFAGNYGSGKTEISLNTALALAKDRKTTLVDMDVAVSYTHLRAHETGRNLVCRLLLEKKKEK